MQGAVAAPLLAARLAEIGFLDLAPAAQFRRRPLERDAGGNLIERQANDRLILTVEGTAPASGPSDFALANRAVRYLEVMLDRLEPSDCENRGGQIGAGPTGSGFDQCDPVTAEAILGGATEVLPGQQ